MFMVELGADSYYSLLGVDPNATFPEIRAARDQMVKDLRARQRREPTHVEELLDRQKQVNAAGEVLVRPANRERYDAEHPYLRFFTPRSAAAPMFTADEDRLDVLYRAIAAHLDRMGVPLPPLSDLDRADFTDDLTPVPLLDGRGTRRFQPDDGMRA